MFGQILRLGPKEFFKRSDKWALMFTSLDGRISKLKTNGFEGLLTIFETNGPISGPRYSRDANLEFGQIVRSLNLESDKPSSADLGRRSHGHVWSDSRLAPKEFFKRFDKWALMFTSLNGRIPKRKTNGLKSCWRFSRKIAR